MTQTCDEVLSELGLEKDPLFRIAQKLERIATEDEYFVQKKLYPNVDFYSGIILRALGIPTNMFTVIFATGRTIGWIAHWHEMISASYKIGRPRQLYTGYTPRDYVPIDRRSRSAPPLRRALRGVPERAFSSSSSPRTRGRRARCGADPCP